MSDYTPTTEQVREYFAMALDTDGTRKVPEAEFDRWLAQHDAEVRAAAFNAAADAVPPATMPLGGALGIDPATRMRFQQWLREQAGGAA